MNEWLNLSDGGWWYVAGWTMLHFLWLGTLVALAAGACRLVLRRASANVRYAAALAWLVVLAALPIGIAAWEAAKPQAMGTTASLVDEPSMQTTPAAPGSAGGITGAVDMEKLAAITPTVSNEQRIVPNTAANPRQSRGLNDVTASIAEYLPWLWLTGTPLTFVLLVTGVVGAERLRQSSRIITDGPIADTCAKLVDSLRIGRRVTVAICDRIAAPVLVGIVRPMILLPSSALTGWSPAEIEMVLLHELAHVRRWDNLVNLVQRFIEAALFFHPAVWLLSRWVRAEREACCDAVVVGRTNRPHAYAEMLVEFAACVSELSEPGRPRPRFGTFTRGRGRPGSLVSSAMAAGPLRSRIHRILGLEDDPMLISGKSLGVVMSGLLLVTTLVVLNLPTSTRAEEEQASKSIAVDVPVLVDVLFETGATKFENGDDIKITEVRGTSSTFKPTNEYWIKGTYTLRSNDRATLGANVTAQTSAHAITRNDPEQSIKIERGSGEFKLKLPMHGNGWPHVSFYPANGGQSFGGVYFGTGDSVVKNWSAVYGSAETRKAESHAKEDRGKFPTLEDQKLADAAYRRLGLELEAIGDEDLKRVESLGYDGGILVTQNNGTLFSSEPQRGIAEKDIIVGLHIWPTRSVADVLNVLDRDDLAELNPLKYYLVRLDLESGGGFGMEGPVPKDIVVTGRISVPPAVVRQSQPTMAPQPTPRYGVPLPAPQPAQPLPVLTIPNAGAPQAAVAQPTIVQVAPVAVQPVAEPNFDGAAPDRLTESEKQLLKAAGGVRIEFFYHRESEPCLRAARLIPEFEKEYRGLVSVERIDVAEHPEAAKEAGVSKVPAYQMYLGDRPVQTRTGEMSVEQLDSTLCSIARHEAMEPQVTMVKEPALRYAGKTFNEWRTIWQTELSIERRLEVVKALAAFGASGRGKEASEAILDVAGQLDWSHIDSNSQAGQLKRACIDAFTTGRATDGYRIPVDVWWPLVVPIYENSADKKTIVNYLTRQLPAGNKELIPQLLELSNKGEPTQSLALTGLKTVDPSLQDDRVVSRFRKRLKETSDSPAALQGAITEFIAASTDDLTGWQGPQLRWVPELKPLLFHPEMEVRQAARFAIFKAQPKDAAPLVVYLIKLIDAPGNGQERQDAILALAALGKNAAPAEEKLKSIAADPNDADRFAAAMVLRSMWPQLKNRSPNERNKRLFGPLISELNSDDIESKLDAEQQEVFGSYEQFLRAGGQGGGVF